jgi:hypothetical protein
MTLSLRRWRSGAGPGFQHGGAPPWRTDAARHPPFVGYAAEAERRVQLEVVDDRAPRIVFAQNAIWRSPDGSFHEAGDGALACNVGFLCVGIVAFHLREVLAQQLSA